MDKNFKITAAFEIPKYDSFCNIFEKKTFIEKSRNPKQTLVFSLFLCKHVEGLDK